ncbi:NAD-dependent epimerase/dehydratase family protein [Rubripirellula obstinata]|uniref:NAD-dependent epimerase/dehydratase family protein n=1 Tax=Rubripirellula obstinata TaxID=406547 RepID=UPI0030B87747
MTGGTGLLGNTILRQLTQQGHDLIALVRGDPDPAVFDGIETEFAKGDLADKEAVFAAVQGCDAVIHSAGLIHLGWKRLEESMAVNRDGTRMVVDACCKHDVPLVHIGTVDTLAVGSRGEVADETTELDRNGGKIPCSYIVSKRAGVEEVLAGVDRKLRSVIVHPGFMLGPWDWKPSSGRMIVEVVKAWRPIAPSGGASICDSRDVASGTIAAMQRMLENSIPSSGRQYILAGENWTYYELWKEITRRCGVRGPIMPAGPAQRWIGRVAGDVMSKLSKNEGDLNSAAVRMSSQFHWYDNSRAKEELGYRSRDPSESIDDAINWLERQKMI